MTWDCVVRDVTTEKNGRGLGFRFSLRRADGSLIVVKCADEHLTVDELLSRFREFLLACGYHAESIDQAIADAAPETP